MVSVLSGALSGWTGDVLFDGRSIRGMRPAQVARLGISAWRPSIAVSYEFGG